jgi:hypothetical protein
MLEWNDVQTFLSERHVGNDHCQQKRLQTLMTARIVLQVTAPPQFDGAHLR